MLDSVFIFKFVIYNINRLKTTKELLNKQNENEEDKIRQTDKRDLIIYIVNDNWFTLLTATCFSPFKYYYFVNQMWLCVAIRNTEAHRNDEPSI